MMTSITQYFGVDVSKDVLDILELSQQGQSQENKQIDNLYDPLESWVKTLSKESAFCIVDWNVGKSSNHLF